jgi:hypothetical protein
VPQAAQLGCPTTNTASLTRRRPRRPLASNTPKSRPIIGAYAKRIVIRANTHLVANTPRRAKTLTLIATAKTLTLIATAKTLTLIARAKTLTLIATAKTLTLIATAKTLTLIARAEDAPSLEPHFIAGFGVAFATEFPQSIQRGATKS